MSGTAPIIPTHFSSAAEAEEAERQSGKRQTNGRGVPVSGGREGGGDSRVVLFVQSPTLSSLYHGKKWKCGKEEENARMSG